MIYVLIANISLVIGYLLYRIAFRKLTFFHWNRFYLLGIVVLSFLLPVGIFINLPSNEIVDKNIPVIDLTNYLEITINHDASERPLYLMDILSYVYWIGVVVTAVLFLIRLRRLFQKMRVEDGYNSYSFFNKIIIGNAIKNVRNIEAHEQIHVQERHSYDLLFMELVKMFNWFNPVIYFLQKELKFQHECIADDYFSSDKVAYAEMLVAHALRTDHLPMVHEFSNESFLKKRIMMLFKNKSTQKHKLWYVSVVPMAFVVLGSTLIFNTSRAKEIVSDTELTLKNVELPITKNLKDQFELPSNIDLNHAYEIHPNDTTVFSNAEHHSEQTDGMNAFMKWVENNLQVPKEAIDKQVKGMILISFIVEKDGRLSNFVVKKDLGYGTKEAVIQLLENAPKWNPGVQDGKPVRVKYTLPIRLNYSKKEEESGKSEIVQSDTLPPSKNIIFTKTEMLPEPPNGMKNYMKWIGENYDFPKQALEHVVNGIVEIKFIVEKDGALSNFEIIKDLGYGTGESAVNLLKKSPKWRPGAQNGRKVRVAYVMPIRLNTLKQ